MIDVSSTWADMQGDQEFSWIILRKDRRANNRMDGRSSMQLTLRPAYGRGIAWVDLRLTG